MGIDVKTLAIAKKYTKESLLGGGAVVGKNVTISDISPITGGNRVTFSYTLDDGSVKTVTLDVMNGENGTDGKDGISMPKGGISGQILAKKSNNDYDAEWIDFSYSSSGNLDDYTIIQGILENLDIDDDDFVFVQGIL